MEYVEFVEFIVRISDLDFYNREQSDLAKRVEQTLQSVYYIF